jgi:beta-galactosidase
VIADVLELAKLTGADQRLPAPVKVKHGTSNAGKRMHFYLNYSGEAQSFPYPYGTGTELTSNKPLAANAMLRVGPWDLAIVEEW